MNQNQLKLFLQARLHFDGTTMAIEVGHIADANATQVFYGSGDVGAKVIEFLRAKGLDVYDHRLKQEVADPRSLPISIDYDPLTLPAQAETESVPELVTYSEVEEALREREPAPIFGGDIDKHHVKHDIDALGRPQSPPNPLKEEISL